MFSLNIYLFDKLYNTIQYNTLQFNKIKYNEFTNWDPERSLLDFSHKGIIPVFSCINICHGSRKLFEPEAARSRVQTTSERHG